MKARLTAYCLVAAACLGGNASAATITFNTSDGQFDTGVDNQGWWSATNPNSDSSAVYFTGETAGHLLRSFFSFDLSSLNLSGQTIVSATFEAVRYLYPSPDASETIAFFDVSTPAATLNANDGVSAVIYADLGSGTSYGSFVVPAYASSTTQTLLFSLNAAAFVDIAIAANAGGYFSIGGSLQTAVLGGSVEGLFANSSGLGIQRLVLEVQPVATPVPEPTSLLLLGTGLVAGARRLRRGRANGEV